MEMGECIREQLAPESAMTAAVSSRVGCGKSFINWEMLQMILTLATIIEFGQVDSRYFKNNGIYIGAPQF